MVVLQPNNQFKNNPAYLEEKMKRIIVSILSLVFMSMVALAQSPATSEPATTTTVKKETASRPKKEMAPKTDSEIQKCIEGKFARSEKLRPQGFSTSVSDGLVTLSGKAANAGSKGAATGIAKSCGAGSVTNNITAPAIPRPKKDPAKTN